MKQVFADTHYWIAVVDAVDLWHDAARAAKAREMPAILVTTDEVLVEVLNAFSGRGRHLREAAADLVLRLRQDLGVHVVEQSRASFDAGMSLYQARHDKAYSLVDCISMITTRRMRIASVLTQDRHFAQEGFSVLIS